MGRHAASGERYFTAGAWDALRSGRVVFVAAAIAVAVAVGVVIGPSDARARLPWTDRPACRTQLVSVVASPDIRPVVSQVLLPVDGTQLPQDGCVKVDVRAQEPQETVAGAAILPIDRAPDVWIPNATYWGEKVKQWQLDDKGSFASSPVVLATSKAAADVLGWSREAPTWEHILRGPRPVAVVQDLASRAETLFSLLALWQTMGRGARADEALTSVVLAADRSEVPTPEAGLAVARSGSANAPVLPVTEEQVIVANRTQPKATVQAIYPAEGSPMLSYPILRVGKPGETPNAVAAVQRVLNRLMSDAARNAVVQAGFHDRSGRIPIGEGISLRPVKTLGTPPSADVSGTVARINRLARPSRLLLLIDVSTSMTQKLQDGISRIALASAATRFGSDELPDRTSVGIWIFAANMQGTQDWRELSPIAPLGSLEKSGETHRSATIRAASQVSRYLSDRGTGLYNTTLAAVRYMRKTYDPKAMNAVLVLTDGTNDVPGGVTLQQLIRELQRERGSSLRVPVFTGGLGPDADYAALDAIAVATGAVSAKINSARDGQAALLNGLRVNRGLSR